MVTRYKSGKNGSSEPVAQVYSADEHKIQNSKIDKDALWAIRKIQGTGAEAYIVGGAVRDLLLDKTPKDFDIATSASPRQIQRLFWNSRVIGKRFKIVHLFFNEKIIEVTTFRSDEENFEEGNNNIFGTIEQDSKRRDFTLNSLYYNPVNGQLLDFNNAMEDLDKKVIRSLIPLRYSFSEDPVRMVRAIKYHCTTGFRLKTGVRFAIRRNWKNLASISTSRLTEEVNKIIGSGYCKDIFLELHKYKLLVYMLPCYSVYIKYPTVLEALDELDKKVKENKQKGIEMQRSQQLFYLIEPLILIDDNYENSEARFKEIFRQAKILISPMTPPNYDIENACSLVLESHGFKHHRAKKQNLPQKGAKKKPAPRKRKPAASEDKREVNKKKIKGPSGKLNRVPTAEPKTLAEARDD